jgi:enoyl-CoA hydratase/carnithine racemase
VPEQPRSPASGSNDPLGGSPPAVRVEQDGLVRVLTLERPPHNLLAEPDLAALADALHDAAGSARAVVLASKGRSFCAGANFRSEDAPDPTDAQAFRTRTAAFYAQARRIFAAPLPVVAAIHGAAIGAGFGIALACDLRVMSPQAFFQANFVALGIHPGFGLTLTLPRLVGPGRAADLFLTGRRVAGEEAVALGLAERLVPPGHERAAALELAHQIAQGAPLALTGARRTLRRDLAETAAEAMAEELREQAALAGTADAREGVAAVLERRAPRFEGR